MKKAKKKYRLKKWAQTVYATVAAICFCFMVGLSTCDFSFTSIVIIAVIFTVFGVSMHMLEKYGRIED